jgi:hypothetical protein
MTGCETLAREAWKFIGENSTQLLTILTLVLASATFGLFKRTAMLADATKQLARETVNSALLTDWHHQQSLSGVMVLSRARVIFRLEMRLDSRRSLLQLNGQLRNVGFGPAMRVRVVAHHPPSGQTRVLRYAAMSVGDCDVLEQNPKAIVFDMTDIRGTAPELADDDRHFTVAIRWENIFGGRQLEGVRGRSRRAT